MATEIFLPSSWSSEQVLLGHQRWCRHIVWYESAIRKYIPLDKTKYGTESRILPMLGRHLTTTQWSHLSIIFRNRVWLSCSGWPWTYSSAPTCLEPIILLPQLPECLGLRACALGLLPFFFKWRVVESIKSFIIVYGECHLNSIFFLGLYI